MGRKTVALSLDEEIYEQYQDYCKKNFIVLSRKIEDMMKKELKNDSEK